MSPDKHYLNQMNQAQSESDPKRPVSSTAVPMERASVEIRTRGYQQLGVRHDALQQKTLG